MDAMGTLWHMSIASGVHLCRWLLCCSPLDLVHVLQAERLREAEDQDACNADGDTYPLSVRYLLEAEKQLQGAPSLCVVPVQGHRDHLCNPAHRRDVEEPLKEVGRRVF